MVSYLYERFPRISRAFQSGFWLLNCWKNEIQLVFELLRIIHTDTFVEPWKFTIFGLNMKDFFFEF